MKRPGGRPRVPRVITEKSGAANRLIHVRTSRKLGRIGVASQTRAVKRQFIDNLPKGLYSQSTLRQRLSCKLSRNQRVELENFSLLRNPDESLRKMIDLVTLSKHAKRYYVDFKDSYCKDIGSYLLFSLLFKKIGNKKSRGGNITPAVEKVLNKLGIDQYTGMKLKKRDDWDVLPLSLEVHASKKDDNNFGISSTREEQVAIKVVDSLSRWIATCQLGFSDEASYKLMTGLSEVFENGRHASASRVLNKKIGIWATTGFMAFRKNEDGEYESWCHLAIATTGRSIAESLASSPNPQMIDRIERYVGRHVGVNSEQGRDELLTVAAIQDSISSDKDVGEGGGCGLGQLINSFSVLGGEKLGNEAPLITILSGNTCVKMHPPYNKMAGETGASYQYFNRENIATVAPDPSYVYKLGSYLPGTIITSRFLIDRKWLHKVLEKDE